MALLAISLVVLLSFPRMEKNNDLSWFDLYWNKLSHLKPDQTSQKDNQKLQIENQLLKLENERLRKILEQTEIAQELIEKSVITSKEKIDRHQQILQNQIDTHLDVIPAKVIYRSPSAWNSSIWVNVGEQENREIGRKVIAKNSPVLLGNSIVGVVEEVNENQSRIRLITDSALSPSVRVKRIQDGGKITYLAKGYLQGSGNPIWRSRGQVLRGRGFNYDHADEEGPARDLRTGEPLKDKNAAQYPLIVVDDLLVTTGMDGVFPADFEVATVTKISPLREGDYYYEIEGRSTVGDLDGLSIVFIVPPTGQTKS
jgi:cell shape-determining protein MreC